MKTDEYEELLEDSETLPTRTERELRKRLAARIAMRRMLLLLAILSAPTAVVRFGIAKSFWPLWLAEHQMPVAGLLLFMLVFILLLSPIIVEYERDPRPFSGSRVPWYLHGW